MDQFKGAEKWLNPTNVILFVAFWLAGTSLNTKLDQIQESHDWMNQEKSNRRNDSIAQKNKFDVIDATQVEFRQTLNSFRNSLNEQNAKIYVLINYSTIPKDEKSRYTNEYFSR